MYKRLHKMMATGYTSPGSGKPKHVSVGFSEAVLKKMYEYYQEGQFCDFKVMVEGTKFEVHQLVMASSSDYFQAMLSHDMRESRESVTHLKDMTVRGFEALVEYVYTGALELDIENIPDVMSGATFLQIQSAIDLCVDFLEETLTFDNAEEVLKLSDLFNVESLRVFYRNYVLKNFASFMESESFLKTDVETLANYLEDDCLKTTSESILLHNCLRWYNHDKETREKDVHQIMEKIRMNIDGWPLIHFAERTEPFISNPKCKAVLDFFVDYMAQGEKRFLKVATNRTRVRSPRHTLVQIGGVMVCNENYDTMEDMMDSPVLDPVGWDMNHYFHPDLKAWFPLGCMGRWNKRLSHQVFVEMNGCGVLIGGYEHVINAIDGEVNRLCIKDVMMFSAQGSFQYWDLPSLGHQRARHAAVFMDGCIYAIGGKDQSQVLKSVEYFDCDTEMWNYAKPLPEQQYDHAAVVCDGKIYLSGGASAREAKKSLWCYDPTCGRWKLKKDLINARVGHGMASVGGRVYAAGGHKRVVDGLDLTSNIGCLSSVEQYDPNTNEWTEVAPMKHGISMFSMTVMDGYIVVMGGVDASSRLTQYIHRYNHEDNHWQVFGEMPRPLQNACCGAIPVKLTATGCMEDETDDIVEQYQDLFEDHEFREARRSFATQTAMMMENFDPGDYLLDYDVDGEDYSDSEAYLL